MSDTTRNIANTTSSNGRTPSAGFPTPTFAVNQLLTTDIAHLTSILSDTDPSSSSITALCCSRDSRFLASARQDGTVTLWDRHEEEELWSATAGSVGVQLNFSSKAELVTARLLNGMAVVWDREIGAELAAVKDRNIVALLPDGRMATGTLRVAPRFDCAIFEGATDRKLEIPTGARWSSAEHALSSDGTHVLGANARIGVAMIEISTGKIARSFPGLEASPRCLAFSSDGRKILLATSDVAVVWDAESGDQLLRTKLAAPARLVVFSHDGSRILVADDEQIHLQDLDDGNVLETIKLSEAKDAPTALAFSGDGREFMIGTQGGRILTFALDLVMPLVEPLTDDHHHDHGERDELERVVCDTGRPAHERREALEDLIIDTPDILGILRKSGRLNTLPVPDIRAWEKQDEDRRIVVAFTTDPTAVGQVIARDTTNSRLSVAAAIVPTLAHYDPVEGRRLEQIIRYRLSDRQPVSGGPEAESIGLFLERTHAETLQGMITAGTFIPGMPIPDWALESFESAVDAILDRGWENSSKKLLERHIALWLDLNLGTLETLGQQLLDRLANRDRSIVARFSARRAIEELGTRAQAMKVSSSSLTGRGRTANVSRVIGEAAGRLVRILQDTSEPRELRQLIAVEFATERPELVEEFGLSNLLEGMAQPSGELIMPLPSAIAERKPAGTPTGRLANATLSNTSPSAPISLSNISAPVVPAIPLAPAARMGNAAPPPAAISPAPPAFVLPLPAESPASTIKGAPILPTATRGLVFPSIETLYDEGKATGIPQISRELISKHVVATTWTNTLTQLEQPHHVPRVLAAIYLIPGMVGRDLSRRVSAGACLIRLLTDSRSHSWKYGAKEKDSLQWVVASLAFRMLMELLKSDSIQARSQGLISALREVLKNPDLNSPHLLIDALDPLLGGSAGLAARTATSMQEVLLEAVSSRAHPTRRRIAALEALMWGTRPNAVGASVFAEGCAKVGAQLPSILADPSEEAAWKEFLNRSGSALQPSPENTVANMPASDVIPATAAVNSSAPASMSASRNDNQPLVYTGQRAVTRPTLEMLFALRERPGGGTILALDENALANVTRYIGYDRVVQLLQDSGAPLDERLLALSVAPLMTSANRWLDLAEAIVPLVVERTIHTLKIEAPFPPTIDVSTLAVDRLLETLLPFASQNPGSALPYLAKGLDAGLEGGLAGLASGSSIDRYLELLTQLGDEGKERARTLLMSCLGAIRRTPESRIVAFTKLRTRFDDLEARAAAIRALQNPAENKLFRALLGRAAFRFIPGFIEEFADTTRTPWRLKEGVPADLPISEPLELVPDAFLIATTSMVPAHEIGNRAIFQLALRYPLSQPEELTHKGDEFQTLLGESSRTFLAALRKSADENPLENRVKASRAAAARLLALLGLSSDEDRLAKCMVEMGGWANREPFPGVAWRNGEEVPAGTTWNALEPYLHAGFGRIGALRIVARSLLFLGKRYDQGGRLEHALSACQQAMELDGSDIEIRLVMERLKKKSRPISVQEDEDVAEISVVDN